MKMSWYRTVHALHKKILMWDKGKEVEENLRDSLSNQRDVLKRNWYKIPLTCFPINSLWCLCFLFMSHLFNKILFTEKGLHI